MNDWGHSRTSMTLYKRSLESSVIQIKIHQCYRCVMCKLHLKMNERRKESEIKGGQEADAM
jgi:hypothetical protein